MAPQTTTENDDGGDDGDGGAADDVERWDRTRDGDGGERTETRTRHRRGDRVKLLDERYQRGGG